MKRRAAKIKKPAEIESAGYLYSFYLDAYPSCSFSSSS